MPLILLLSRVMNPHPFSQDASHDGTARPAQPQGQGRRLGQIWPAGHVRRLGGTIAFSWRRMWRSPVGERYRLWPRQLSIVALVGAVAVAILFPFDARVMDFVLSHRGRLTGWMAALSQSGKSEWFLVPALVFYLLAATADWRGNGHRVKSRLVTVFGQSAFLFGAVAISGIAVNLVKIVVGRARPWMFGEVGAYHFDPFVVSKYLSSFPSGHSTTLGAVAAVLCIWFPRQWPLFCGVGIVLSMMRVAAAAHYPSDVVAGFFFGVIVTVVMARFLAARRVGFRPRAGRMLPAAIGLRRR